MSRIEPRGTAPTVDSRHLRSMSMSMSNYTAHKRKTSKALYALSYVPFLLELFHYPHLSYQQIQLKESVTTSVTTSHFIPCSLRRILELTISSTRKRVKRFIVIDGRVPKNTKLSVSFIDFFRFTFNSSFTFQYNLVSRSYFKAITSKGPIVKRFYALFAFCARRDVWEHVFFRGSSPFYYHTVTHA